TQACKALRADGYQVVLVNSNPATIMTDPEVADRTYIEPLTRELLEQVIARERPDAVLPTVGGQTGLNLAVELAEAGVLERYGIELIGASLRAIKVAEDRLLFKDTCWGGKSSNLKGCGMFATTSWWCARSRISIPWAFTLETPLRWPPRRHLQTRNTSACATPPPRSSAKWAWRRADRTFSSPWS